MSLKPSATIRYTAMRLGIFVGCLAVVAVLVLALAGWFLLKVVIGAVVWLATLVAIVVALVAAQRSRRWIEHRAGLGVAALDVRPFVVSVATDPVAAVGPGITNGNGALLVSWFTKRSTLP